MANNTSNTNNTILYNASTRENFNDWKHTLDSLLTKHPDKLLTVAQNGKLSASATIKLKAQYKQLALTFDGAAEKEHYDEANSQVYYLIIPTIGDQATLNNIKRLCGTNHDGAKAYKIVCDNWDIKADKMQERMVRIDNERSNYIRAGAKSCNTQHMSEFVEGMLRFNTELAGTPFEMQEPTLVSHLLTAIKTHNPAMATSFRTTRIGVADWDQDFDAVWDLLKPLIASGDAEDAEIRRNTDVLTTTTHLAKDDRVAQLEAELLELKTLLATRTRDTPKAVCPECNFAHAVDKDYGCLGKACVTGACSHATGLAKFKWARDPAQALEAAKKRYTDYKGVTPRATPAAGTPPRTMNLAVTLSTSRTDATDTRPIVRFDTQAEDHVFSDIRFFPDGIDETCKLGLDTIVPVGGKTPTTGGRGTAKMLVADGTLITFANAHFYPEGKYNVVATRLFEDRAVINTTDKCLRPVSGGADIPFDAGYCNVYIQFVDVSVISMDMHPEALTAILATNLHFGGISGGPLAPTKKLSDDETALLWKRRTALGAPALKALPDSTDAPASLKKIAPTTCNDHDAMRANMPKVPAKAHGSVREKTICFDLQGPFKPSKHGGNTYAVNFYVIDGKERRYNLDFLTAKDKFVGALEEFLQGGIYQGYQLYTDNEAVLNSNTVKKILRKNKMPPMKNSCAYEPWQNPAERPWRTLAAGAREFIARGTNPDDHPDDYWPYAYLQVANVYNAMHSKGRISHLRVPFCLAYVKTPRPLLEAKLSPQAETCIHLGYSTFRPGYVLEVLDGPRAGKIVTASQVKLREDVFPLKLNTPPPPIMQAEEMFDDGDADYDDDDDDWGLADQPNSDDDDDDDDGAIVIRGRGANRARIVPDSDSESPPPARPTTRSTNPVPLDATVNARLDEAKKQRLAIGVTNLDAENYTRVFKTAVAVVDKCVDDPNWAPRDFSDILKIHDDTLRKEWAEAHYAEIDGLLANPDVLKVVPLPPDVDPKALKLLRTLYTVKSDKRKKGRCVLNAPKGTLDNDYGATFSPTARPATLRLLCALAALHRLTIMGGDVKQAYKQAKWPEHLKKLLARMPAGYKQFFDGQMHCVEVGNLYGHPKAGRNWWKEFEAWMINSGYTQSAFDPCLFFTTRGDEKLWVIIYVDDIITFHSAGSTLRDEWAAKFGEKFEWTDFKDDLHEFLSINITQSEDSVELDMRRYITDAFNEAFPGGQHLVYKTPAIESLGKDVYEASVKRDTSQADTELGKRFRRMTMQMLYVATHVRPDIGLGVGLLTRVQAWPNETLLKHAERIMIYLKSTSDLTLKYAKDGNTTGRMHWAPRVSIHGYSDANFDLAHSTSGSVFLLANAAIDWIMKKQQSIALNTMEAEIMSGSLAACNLIPLRGISEEVGYPQFEATRLFMDSTSGIELANDPVKWSSSKHIARRDLFIRELVARGVLIPTYVKSAHNVADALTKPLPNGPFLTHRDVLLGHVTI